jgi:hypothetical protein
MQVEVILNCQHLIVHGTGQGEAMHRKRTLNLAAVKPMTIQLTSSVLQWLNELGHNLLHKPALTENFCMYYLNVT